MKGGTADKLLICARSPENAGSSGKLLVPVKHTFIHFPSDDLQQLGGIVKKSLSDPIALSSSEEHPLTASSFSSHAEDAESHDAGSPTATPEGRASWSKGAAAHADGRCRPCGWHWKAGGCSNGEVCPFCHLCERGKLSAMKKGRARRGRERIAERQRLRNPSSVGTPHSNGPSSSPAQENTALKSKLSRQPRKGPTPSCKSSQTPDTSEDSFLSTGATSSGTLVDTSLNAAASGAASEPMRMSL